MSLWRTTIILDGPDALSVTVSGLGASNVTAVEPVELTGHSPDEVAELIRALVKDRPHRRGQIRLVLPYEVCECFLRLHQSPLPDEAVAADAVRWLEEECGFDPHASDVRSNAYTRGGRQAVAIAAFERGTLQRYREAFESKGMTDVVMVSPLDAIVQLADATDQATGARTRAVVHVGRTTAAVVVLEDDLPVFFRSVNHDVQTRPCADAYENPALPQFAPTDDACESLSAEIERTLDYYRQAAREGRRVEHVTLSATNLDLRPLADELHRQTQLPCDLAGGWGDASDDPNERLGDVRMALPLSVAAVRKLPPGARLTSTPTRAQKIASSRGTWAALVVLFVAFLIVWYVALLWRTDAYNQTLAERQQKQQQLDRTLAQRQDDYARREHYVVNARTLLRIKLQGALAADMLAVANNLRPSDVNFTQVALATDEPGLFSLALDGVVVNKQPHEALALVDQYAAVLAGLELFDHTYVEKPRLDGPGIPEDEQRGRTIVEPTETGDVAFRLVLQSKTPWSITPAPQLASGDDGGDEL